MSSLLSAEIAATCSALGYFDAAQNKYFADSNSLETVKDLVRYLRRDDENHDIRRQLGQIKVLQTDLLPLLKSYHEEDDLFDVLLRLIMNLTTPPLLLWNFEVPKEKSTRNFYMQVEDHLKSYKEAFTEEGVWAVLSTRLSKILEVDNAERGEENGVKIERILILVRNVLFVPADASERRPDNDASLHDQVVWALQKSGMLDIILFMTSSADEQAYYMYILEIIFFLLREQKPSDLANAALVRSQSEKIRDEAELLAIRHRETTQKQQKTKIYAGTRHSRFGGTFVVKSMKSISDNELIYHKPLNKLDSLNFDTDKRKPKNDYCKSKVDAMKKIQAKLRDREFESAIGLIRAAREVWPENDSFGSSTITPEEEFLALREIFFAELGNVEPPPPQQNSDDSEDDDEEEEEGGPRYSETDFNFDDFIKRLPHPKIIKACGLALRTFETNSVNTNHCILKLLHRIAFDCKMYVMVFQLSIFRTFQKIMSLKDAPQHKELIKFATYILRQFFKVAEKNELVFLEAVFWTAKREAYEIENGYGTFEKTSTASKTWSEEEEDELRRLFMEHQQNQVEEDVVDWICSNLIDNTKSRRIVLKKLKELYLLANYKPKKKSVGRMKPPQNWGAEEEAQLRELYEEFKDAMDPLGCIMSRLEIVRPKNRVVEKLLVMGLVQDKKELRKKRAKSGKRKSNVQGGQSSEGSSDSEAGSDDSTRSVPRLAKNPVKRPSKKSAKVKKKSPPVRAPRSELAKLLLENVEHQHQEALEWLKDSLSDAIEDYEDGNDVGIPLVPIMDYAVAAMEHEAFQKLLKGFGVSEPFVEQEAYWRIPGDIPVDVLTGLCELIQGALDGTLEVQENGSATGPGGSESEEDYLEVLNRNKGQQAAKDSSNEPVDDRPEVSKYKGARKRITKNLSESEDEHPGSNIIEDQEPLDKSLPSTSKNILSESDEEPGQKRSSQSAVNPKNSIETDSEDEGTKETANVINGDTVAGKNMNVLESDSDEDVGSIQKRVRSPDSDSGKPVKRSRVIESDDDDDE
nr:protein timeless homolog [Leptinotarsa decemlineata]